MQVRKMAELVVLNDVPAGISYMLQLLVGNNSVNVKVIKLVKSLIDWEVTVTGRATECHLTFARGRLYSV